MSRLARRARAALPPAGLLAALALLGCVEDHVLGLEVRPPRAPDGGPAVPAAVVSWELRLERLPDGVACPSTEDLAEGRTAGELAHVQVFSAEEGMGMPIGEIPQGRWALSALARDAECAPLLSGCVELEVGEAAPTEVVLEVAEVTTSARCGCRTCEAGACDPPGRLCD